VILLDGGETAPAPMPQWLFWNDFGCPDDELATLKAQGVDARETNVISGHRWVPLFFPFYPGWDRWLFAQHK